MATASALAALAFWTRAVKSVVPWSYCSLTTAWMPLDGRSATRPFWMPSVNGLFRVKMAIVFGRWASGTVISQLVQVLAWLVSSGERTVNVYLLPRPLSSDEAAVPPLMMTMPFRSAIGMTAAEVGV